VENDIGTLDRLLSKAAMCPEMGLRFIDRAEEARWMSWSEIHRKALAVCGALQAVGVEQGARVALIFPTGGEFFDAFFGILLAGAVPGPA